MSRLRCVFFWTKATTLLFLVITTTGALINNNKNFPCQRGGGCISSTKANLFRSEKSSSTTARNYVKTTFDFGNADQLVPLPLGPKTHPTTMMDYKTQKQLEKFVDGRWKRQAPEKSAGEKILGRKYAIDPYGDAPENNFALQHKPQKRIFEDEIEDDEWRLYTGLSVGDQMTQRSYKIDPNTEHSGAKKAHADEMFRPQKFKYYSMLGLDNLASQADIKNAYRRLVKLYHPDANPTKDTTEQYHLLNRAYDVLTDPILKERYDKYGRKGLGTSAASDELKARGTNLNPTPKRIVSSYVVAKSDAGDVKWKGSHGGPSFEVASFGTAPISERALGSSRDRSVLSSSSAMMNGPKKTPMRDLYQTLSVQRGASEGEIKNAYDVMSKRYDPATSKYKKECYILYHHVQRAYEVLSDPQIRKRYDMYGFAGLILSKTPTEPAIATSIRENEATRSSLISQVIHANAGSSALGVEQYPNRYLRGASPKITNIISTSGISPPVQVGGASSHHSSRHTAIQQDRTQSSTHTEKKEFKAPPVQYRSSLAPIPLDNENERFDALVMSDSVPLKASSAKTRKETQNEQSESLSPPAEGVSDQTHIFYPLLDASNTNANATASEEVIRTSPAPLAEKRAISPPVQVGGAPHHQSSRSTSIQMVAAQNSAHMEKKPFKAPPMQFRTTLAPIPLDDENERFDALAKFDSVPLKGTSSKARSTSVLMEELPLTSPRASETTEPIPWPFSLRDSLPSKPALASFKYAVLNTKPAAVTSDQDKVKNSRRSHEATPATMRRPAGTLAAAVASSQGRMEASSRMNSHNNIEASTHRAPPLNALPSIVAPVIIKSRAAVPIFQSDLYKVLSLKEDADKEEIRESYNRLTKKYFLERDTGKNAYILHQEIQRAFKILRDPAKREEYNRHGIEGIAKILSGEKTITAPLESPEILDSIKSPHSTEKLEKYPDLIAPDISHRYQVPFNRDIDIVATKPSSSSRSSTISLHKYCNLKKEFRAPSIQYRSSIAPIPLHEKNERFDRLSESGSVSNRKSR